jgi:hypothetical protein
MDSEPAIAFSNQGLFFLMVATFMLSTTGLGPLYQPDNPPRLSRRDSVAYHGVVEPELHVDLEQIRQMSQHLNLQQAVQQLCCMLMISTHAVVLDVSRNAAAHGNRFTFMAAEPRRPAAWRALKIDRAAHHGTLCFGGLLNAADALALLADIERILAADSNPVPVR